MAPTDCDDIYSISIEIQDFIVPAVTDFGCQCSSIPELIRFKGIAAVSSYGVQDHIGSFSTRHSASISLHLWGFFSNVEDLQPGTRT